MANLKDIRKRISSVRSTQQITKAMKMVAAAKLRRAQEQVEGARPYADGLSELLSHLLSKVSGHDDPLLAPGTDAPAHMVLLSSDRGLCGGYNANLIRVAVDFLAGADGSDAQVTVCGRRGAEFFAKHLGERLAVEHINRSSGLDFDLASQVASDVSKRFIDGEAGSVWLVYSRFHSAISQEPVIEKLLPLQAADGNGSETLDYLYEPDADAILRSLLPRFVRTRLYQSMLEATASEHGARMTAMDSATRNASEMIDRLTLEMNRARQAMITTELMEIVGGAEALKG